MNRNPVRHRLEWVSDMPRNTQWLDGVDDCIYNTRYCYKAPLRFFEALAETKDSAHTFPVRALYSGKSPDYTDDLYQPIALILVEKLRDLGEVEICRYTVFRDEWDWGHAPCRIQLKAMARVMDQLLGNTTPLYRVSPAALQEVQHGKRIPRSLLLECPISNPALEDFGLSPTESAVAKECSELPIVLEYVKAHALDALVRR